MMAGIGDNGVYEDWSPYFNYSTHDLFELSKELPLPTKKKTVEAEGGVNISEFVDILDLKRNKAYTLFLTKLTQLLEVSKGGIVSFDESISPRTRKKIISLIDKHNLSWYKADSAIKNKMFHNMFKIGADPRNYIAETTILSIDLAREAARKSPISKLNSSNSNNNPAAMMIAQEQAAVGKTTIGAYANGIKAFSALATYYKSGILKANEAYNELIRLCQAYVTEGELDISGDIVNTTVIDLERRILEATDNLEEVMSKINRASLGEDVGTLTKDQQTYVTIKMLSRLSDFSKFELKIRAGNERVTALDVSIKDGSRYRDLRLKFSSTLPNIDLLSLETNNPNLLAIISDTRKAGVQQNVFDNEGILLNCATDNAKELILKVINASGEFAKIYTFLVVTGVPFTNITDFMSSDFVTAIANISQRSIFDSATKNRTVDSALKYLTDGVDIKSYFGDFSISATEALRSMLKNELKYDQANESSVSKILKDLSNSEIDQLLNSLKSSKYRDFTKNKKSSIDYDDPNLDLEGSSFSKSINGSFLLTRFLRELKRRNNLIKELGGIEKVTKNAEVLGYLNDAGKEIQMFSRLCGINQGINTMREDTFNRIESIQDFISKRTKEDFDLFRFINDKVYQQEQIDKYENVKSCFNILDAIANSPHFSKMYKAFSVKEDLCNNFSFKYRNFMKCAKELKNRRIIDSLKGPEKRIINRFLDEVVMDDFCRKVNFEFDFNGLDPEVGVYVDDSNILKKGVTKSTITVRDYYDRASFKHIMESYIIPRLKELYPSNSFIGDLQMDYTDRNVVRAINSFYQIPINLNNLDETNESKYTSYINDFNNIKNETFFGVRLEDLFFMYNLLINNNSFGARTFTRLFSDSVKNQTPESVISQFQKYISDLSSEDIYYDINDLLMRFTDSENNSFFLIQGDEDVMQLYNNNNRVEFLYRDNMTLLPFTTGNYTMSKTKEANLEEKLFNLLSSNLATIKLACDE